MTAPDDGRDQVTIEDVAKKAEAKRLEVEAEKKADGVEGSQPERTGAITGEVPERNGSGPSDAKATPWDKIMAKAETPAAKPDAPTTELEDMVALERADPGDVDEILEALAGVLWDGPGECPIPTLDAVAAAAREELDELNPETCTAERWAFARDGRLLWGYGGVCHAQWLETPRPRRVHPLAPVVLEWWKVRMARVRADTRPDPILPVVRVRESPEKLAGQLAFGGLPRDNLPPAQLPMFPVDGPRVPLLELVDRYGVPTMRRGRGAPLELAVYIAACILTPNRVRGSRRVLVTTVRELREFLFGPTWHPSPTGNRPGDWERVREAALNASDLWLPLANGDLWRAVAVRKIPPADYRPEYLDRQVIFDVLLPDGADSGPVIDQSEMTRLRLVSGPKFRAYIAAHSVAWIPGRTRKREHPAAPWQFSRNLSDYPILTAEDRDRLAFGEGSDITRHRSRSEKDAAWEDLPGLVIAERAAVLPDGRIGWRIVPADSHCGKLSGPPAQKGEVPADPPAQKGDGPAQKGEATAQKGETTPRT